MMFKQRMRVATLILATLSLAGCDRALDRQPKVNTYQADSFFIDQMGDRSLVAGTVPRDSESGRPSDQQLAQPQVLARGQERYEIYCSVCHGLTGNGDGMATKRGMPQPPSYHIARLRAAPLEHFYDVMTHGFGRMLSYAARVPPQDRWAIAAYIRTLQVAQDFDLLRLSPAERELTGGSSP